MCVALAIDIGGTKLEVAEVDRDGTIGRRARASSVGASDADDLFGRLATLVESFVSPSVDVVGVGCGGPMEPGGVTVSPLNIEVWRRFPLVDRLSELTGRKVVVDNDAKALALAEAWLGRARGEPNFMAMVVSTGVGGGIVVDGRLLDGSSGNAGHIGHVVVDPVGHDLPGHVRGVLESEASGTAIAHRSGRPAAEADGEMIDHVGVMVGRAVGSVVNLLDLTLVVVAGSVALGFGDRFFAAANRELDRIARLDFSRGARVVPAALGADGPIIGAAAVGWRSLGVDVGVL